MKQALGCICLFVLISANGHCKSNDDRGPDLSGKWPTTMTIEVLENAGLFRAEDVDSAGVWTTRMASERQNKYMWHQLYSLRVKLKSGKTVSAIADINCSSDPDMNMGPVVYVVSTVLQPEGKPEPPRK